jgi:hypothetical protein
MNVLLNGRWPRVQPPNETATVRVYFPRQPVPGSARSGGIASVWALALYQGRCCGL